MKTCTGPCKKEKASTEFQVRRASKDGLTSSCKKCLKERDAARYVQEKGYRAEQHKKYMQTPVAKAIHKKSVEKWEAAHPFRRDAQIALGNAIKGGRVKRLPCLVCGEKAEAHHADYSRPLDVMWLCSGHHKEAHAASIDEASAAPDPPHQIKEFDMPTGYTAAIIDGIDFKTFAMNCARAFGACVMLRDEQPGGDIIPDSFAPSSYHAEKLEQAKRDLVALDAMTPEELEKCATEAYETTEGYRLDALKMKVNQRALYEAMLEKVSAWTPPTEEHKGMKTFMADQITQSIDFDCSGSYYETPTARMTGAEWKQERSRTLVSDLEYHAKEDAAEQARAAGRTKWVQELRASLQVTEPATA